jgi:hypothetical protein
MTYRTLPRKKKAYCEAFYKTGDSTKTGFDAFVIKTLGKKSPLLDKAKFAELYKFASGETIDGLHVNKSNRLIRQINVLIGLFGNKNLVPFKLSDVPRLNAEWLPKYVESGSAEVICTSISIACARVDADGNAVHIAILQIHSLSADLQNQAAIMCEALNISRLMKWFGISTLTGQRVCLLNPLTDEERALAAVFQEAISQDIASIQILNPSVESIEGIALDFPTDRESSWTDNMPLVPAFSGFINGMYKKTIGFIKTISESATPVLTVCDALGNMTCNLAPNMEKCKHTAEFIRKIYESGIHFLPFGSTAWLTLAFGVLLQEPLAFQDEGSSVVKVAKSAFVDLEMWFDARCDLANYSRLLSSRYSKEKHQHSTTDPKAGAIGAAARVFKFERDTGRIFAASELPDNAKGCIPFGFPGEETDAQRASRDLIGTFAQLLGYVCRYPNAKVSHYFDKPSQYCAFETWPRVEKVSKYGLFYTGSQLGLPASYIGLRNDVAIELECLIDMRAYGPEIKCFIFVPKEAKICPREMTAQFLELHLKDEFRQHVQAFKGHSTTHKYDSTTVCPAIGRAVSIRDMDSLDITVVVDGRKIRITSVGELPKYER